MIKAFTPTKDHLVLAALHPLFLVLILLQHLNEGCFPGLLMTSKTDHLPGLCSLTHWRHLGHAGPVRPLQELWLVVIDVLNLDDKLGLGL